MYCTRKATYIHSINKLFEPNQSPPHPVPQSILVPEPTYEFQPNLYPNLYAVTQPYLTPHVLLPEDTVTNKTHKWWSFHNLKEKFKSFFKHKHKHNDESQNSANANLFINQPHLQPGKIQNFHQYVILCSKLVLF